MWSVVPVKFCGDCGVRVNPGFPCSGPCGRSFHQFCANINKTCLDAMAINSGLMWFCGDCQQGVRRARLAEQESSVAGVEQSLPPEVWERIFVNLNQDQLLQVRETCRYWRNVVDGSRKLLDTLTVYFPSNCRMDPQFVPKHLFPAEATRAVWHKFPRSEIVDVDAWWPPFGARLTEMFLGACEVTMLALLTMLRHTPNLIKLNVRIIEYETDYEPNIDFQLVKMRHFTSQYNLVKKDLEICAQIFPFLTNHYNCYANNDIFDFVSTLQRTLIEVNLSARGNMLAKIGNLEHLKLERVSLFGTIENSVVLQFCAAQPSLVDINFSTPLNNDILCSIGRACPNLTRFYGVFDDNAVFVPSFLSTMPKLECFELAYCGNRGNYLVVNFEGLKNIHLTEIILRGIKPFDQSLQQYFQNAPKLTTVYLDDCCFSRWSLALDTLRGVKSLQDLFIALVVTEDDAPDSVHASFDRLELLELYCADIPMTVVDSLLAGCCTTLKELSFIDKFALKREMNSLKKLKINCVAFGDTDAQDIVKYCRELQELELFKVRMSESCNALLEQAFGRKMIVK